MPLGKRKKYWGRDRPIAGLLRSPGFASERPKPRLTRSTTLDDTRLTVAAWAKRLGISRQAGYAAVSRLGIEVVDGKVPAAKATAVYRALTRPRVSRRSAAASTGEPDDSARISYDEAKRREAIAKALMAEREQLAHVGQLVSKAARDAAWQRTAVQIREAIWGLAPRAAPRLVGKTEAEIFELLTEESRQVLEDLNRGQEAP